MTCSRRHLVFVVVATMLLGSGSASARQSTPTAGDAPPIEMLLDVELPAEALPEGPVNVVLAHWAWEPGATARVPAGAWEVGIVIDHVLQGSYTATSGGDVFIVTGPADGTTRDIAPGVEFDVDQNSGAVYLQNEATWQFRNAEETRGAGLGGGIFSTAAPTSADPVAEHGITYTELASVELDQIEPADALAFTFRYWRTTLAPGQSIPAAGENVIQLVGVDPKLFPIQALAVAADGSSRNDGTEAITVYGLTLSPAS